MPISKWSGSHTVPSVTAASIAEDRVSVHRLIGLQNVAACELATIPPALTISPAATRPRLRMRIPVQSSGGTAVANSVPATPAPATIQSGTQSAGQDHPPDPASNSRQVNRANATRNAKCNARYPHGCRGTAIRTASGSSVPRSCIPPRSSVAIPVKIVNCPASGDWRTTSAHHPCWSPRESVSKARVNASTSKTRVAPRTNQRRYGSGAFAPPNAPYWPTVVASREMATRIETPRARTIQRSPTAARGQALFSAFARGRGATIKRAEK